jgi:hypothetical protein
MLNVVRNPGNANSSFISNMETNWTREIISQWKVQNINLNTGAIKDNIAELEKQLDFKFPTDFHEMYMVVNGFANDDWTSNMFSLWPLLRILKEYQEGENLDFIGFCEYLINSHSLGFSRSRAGVFISYALAEPVEFQEVVALTFKEALYLINTDSEKIY